MIYWPSKGPAEVEDFGFDFTGVLQVGESIATHAVAAVGVTKDAEDETDGVVTVVLSGGAAGTTAVVTCTVETDSTPPRTYSETALLPIGVEPISLSLVKQHLRIEHEDEDVLIGAYLSAAVHAVEGATSKYLMPRQVVQTLNGFAGTCRTDGSIQLWSGPVGGDDAIASIAYDDSDGVEQALTSFRLVEGANARILPAFGECWPTTAPGGGTVRITYTAGYAPGELPAALEQAVLMLTGHYYANREAVNSGTAAAAVELPLAVAMLIGPYRPVGLA